MINTESRSTSGGGRGVELPARTVARQALCHHPHRRRAWSRERVAWKRRLAGLVFAVDPTSASASCIGGNIAMNAGGKGRAVGHGARQPGVVEDGHAGWQTDWLEVERLDHNLGKIHEQADGAFSPRADEASGKGHRRRGAVDAGRVFRRDGLGKDVTDKFLGICRRAEGKAPTA